MEDLTKRLKKLTPLQLLVVIIIAAILLVQQLLKPNASLPDAAATLPAMAETVIAELPTEEEATQPAAVEEMAPTQTPAAARPTKTARPAATSQAAVEVAPGKFDYFVLSLSWSPDYCATTGQNDAQQCSIGKKLGFVLHGLWPQNKVGYPANCSNEKLTADAKAKFPNLYPSTTLYDHEWEKHGTCSGLPAEKYLALSKRIKESVVIPAAFKAPQKTFRTTVDEMTSSFVDANPGTQANTFAINCSGSGRYLKELYVCFAKDGQPTTCSAEVLKTAAKSCQAKDFQVRNTR
jgi:ribonuclease T2